MNRVPPPTSPRGVQPDITVLAETDELLDRLGRREANLHDLDDPVLASLAVLAADVDLDQPTPDRTRRAMLEGDLWPPLPATRLLSAAGDALGLSIVPPDDVPQRAGDLLAAAGSTADAWDLGVVRDEDDVRDSWSGAASELAEVPVQRAGGAGGWVPPVRAGSPSRRNASYVQPKRITLRLVPTLTAVGAALVLSMGAAAALTGGESVNPARALSEMVSKIADIREPRTTMAETTPASPSERVRVTEPGASGTSPGTSPFPGVSPSGLGQVFPASSPSGVVLPSDGGDGSGSGTGDSTDGGGSTASDSSRIYGSGTATTGTSSSARSTTRSSSPRTSAATSTSSTRTWSTRHHSSTHAPTRTTDPRTTDPGTTDPRSTEPPSTTDSSTTAPQDTSTEASTTTVAPTSAPEATVTTPAAVDPVDASASKAELLAGDSVSSATDSAAGADTAGATDSVSGIGSVSGNIATTVGAAGATDAATS